MFEGFKQQGKDWQSKASSKDLRYKHRTSERVLMEQSEPRERGGGGVKVERQLRVQLNLGGYYYKKQKKKRGK